ncbi:MAG: substrate-binding domain-containing protein [Rudaea sp.]
MSPIYGLLGLLAQGERYGYELKRIVDQDYSPFWRIDFAQLYRSLARIVRAGWADARLAPGGKGPERKVYRLTRRGRQEFAAWLVRPCSDPDELLVKLRLAEGCGMRAAVLPAIQQFDLEPEHERRLAAHRAARESGDAGALLLAHAALEQLEAEQASLDVAGALFAVPPVRPTRPPSSLLISGSDDPLLARLAGLCLASNQVVGSLAGLLALARREADVAAVHLLDAESGEYNVPFVRHLLPEDDLLLVNLAYRENGLMLAHGNPKKIHSVRDLARPGVRLVNRTPGTGTRLLLAARLRAARVDPRSLPGWEGTAATHAAVAAAICAGRADVGPGLRAVAEEWGLDFLPLGEERFDLVVEQEALESARLEPLLAALHGREFNQSAAKYRGYDLRQSGQIVAHVK